MLQSNLRKQNLNAEFEKFRPSDNFNSGFVQQKGLLVSSLAMIMRSEVVSLCRALLRAGRQYPDYNIREYTKRKTLDGFRMNKNLTDQSKVNEAYAEAKTQLEVVERVLKVYLAYPPKTKNIMEVKLH